MQSPGRVEAGHGGHGWAGTKARRLNLIPRGEGGQHPQQAECGWRPRQPAAGAQSHLPLGHPTDCSQAPQPLGTLQTGELEWASFPSPGDLPAPGPSLRLCVSALAGGLCITSTTGEAPGEKGRRLRLGSIEEWGEVRQWLSLDKGVGNFPFFELLLYF